MPIFSVIMNCLNGERFLKEAIDSVFFQTFSDWEIIFFDSGSTDKSVEIASGYGSKVKIFRLEKPVPLGQARQEAVDKATGDFFAFLDVDDVWLPFKLQIQYDLMKSGEYDICYGGIQCIDEHGRFLHKIMPIHCTGLMFEKQLRQFECNTATMVVNRTKLLISNVKFDPTFFCSSEPDFILRFLAIKGSGTIVNQVLAKYRITKNSVTTYYMGKWMQERHVFIDRLSKENPMIKESFSKALNSAFGRGFYYNAYFLIEEKRYCEAPKCMYLAVKLDKKYLPLYILSFVPSVWNLIHGLKSHLSPFWLKYMFLPPNKTL